MSDISLRPCTLKELRNSGWRSRSVKHEVQENFVRQLQTGDELFPGIIGYDNTVIPEINIALLAGHDMLFLGEKGQAKSRLMRSLVRFLDEEIPYLDIPGCPVHEDPYHPITAAGKRLIAEQAEETSSHRLVAAEGTLRRAAGAGHQVRRHHRRDRSRPSWPPARACRPKRPCTSG